MKKTNINLIPDIQNPTPDYYCTWQTQLYATNDGKPQGQRAIIGEKAFDGSLISQVQSSEHTPKGLVTTSLAIGIPQGLMFGASFNVRAIIRISIMLIMLHHSSYVYLCMGRYDNSV